MLERPEHVFALSRMLLFGFTEATGSVRERCDTFGDLQPPLVLETRLQTEPDVASAVSTVTLWNKVRCQQLYENMFLNGASPNLNWNASKLCNSVLTRLLLEVGRRLIVIAAKIMSFSRHRVHSEKACS